MKNPIVYAIAYKYEECYWVKFVGDGLEDTSDLDFSCFLPTEEMANEYIVNVLGDGYEVVEIEIEKYHNGVTVFTYEEPKAWREEEQFDI